MAVTIVLKIGLFIFCKTVKDSVSVDALAQDHRNDVVTNVFGLITAVVGHYWVWYIDPLGGIFIGLYIMQNWFRTGFSNYN